MVNVGPVCLISAGTLLAGTMSLGRTAAAGPDETALLKEIGFSSPEIQRIRRGEVVARTTEADSSTIALVVAGTVDVPPAFYLEKFRDIVSFKKTQEVLQIGRLGRPPKAADMAGLSLSTEDVDDLRGCRVGDCGIKLDLQGIEKVARRDAHLETASAAMREHLAAYLQKYLPSGNAALMEYHDGSRPRRLADELRMIAERSSYLQRGWPVLFDAVFHFNGTLPSGLEHFLYWSKEKIGPRPVVSLTHAIVSPVQDGAAAIATKQVYASHYSNASLGLTILIDRSTPEIAQTRVVYVNHSRVDLLGGVFGAITRPLIRSRARDGAERAMRGLRDRLEKQYGPVLR